MSTVSFKYRQKQSTDSSYIFVQSEDLIRLAENVEYILEFEGEISSDDQRTLNEIEFDFITQRMGILCFRNFVGIAHLGGARIHVISSKLGEDGVSGLLEQISILSSTLIFGWRSPVNFASANSQENGTPIAFHQLQFLRDVILRRPAGQRLQDFLFLVERNPIKQFQLERRTVTTERAKNLDWRSVKDVFRHPERLATVKTSDWIAGHPLAKSLKIGVSLEEHFPIKVSIASRRLSFDTLENRFIKHFLNESLSVVYRLLDKKSIHVQMRDDCREMATILESCIHANFLTEVGPLTSFSGPSQCLAKTEGYKELFDLWMQINSHQSLPTNAAEIERLLQGKDVALLYEYWVFLKVLEAAREVEPASKMPIKIHRTELGERLDRGLKVYLNDNVFIAFNPSYVRSRGDTYSTPLRPDVILSINGTRFAFDAKYRLQWQTDREDEQIDDATYVRADLYKMHTYRDAITNLKAAFVIYPGNDFVFFERGEGRHCNIQNIRNPDGVGAIPLRPDAINESPLLPLITLLFGWK